MAYEVIILGHLHMPLYFLGTFTEYPYVEAHTIKQGRNLSDMTLGEMDALWEEAKKQGL